MRLLLWHGTNQDFSKVGFDARKARMVNDFYGGGVAYFTDSESVAKGYARSMFKRGVQNRVSNNMELVFKVYLQINNLFDVDHTFTGKELSRFIDKGSEEKFAYGAGLLNFSYLAEQKTDKYGVLAKLAEGSLTLTGDQVFKGLSRGMVNTADARQKLINLGYDTLRYNGGNMNITGINAVKHNVYITYNGRNASIVEAYILDSPQLNINGTSYKKTSRT